jgi:putative transposase
MSRSARLVVPGYPHHIVHRGHNRRVIFERLADHAAYLEDLRELKTQYGVKIYAYCLMSNHVHLLLVPETADGLAQVMKRVAGRHALRLNGRNEHTGALWQGRYYSSVVDRDAYFLTCCRYIELNPVRAGLASDPVDYPWSSCRFRRGERAPAWLDLDPLFLAMGNTPAERWACYRELLDQRVADDQRELIREAVHRGQLTGGPDFSAKLLGITGRLVERRGPGRPRKIDPSQLQGK